MYSCNDTACAVGCPIRISTDQSLLAAPHGFSQRATSFIASWCQGIHRMPFLCSRPAPGLTRGTPCTETILSISRQVSIVSCQKQPRRSAANQAGESIRADLILHVATGLRPGGLHTRSCRSVPPRGRNQRHDLHTPLNTRRRLKGRLSQHETALPVRHAAGQRPVIRPCSPLSD